MRFAPVIPALFLLLFGCNSGPSQKHVEQVADGPVRVIHQQFYRGSKPTILESISGRSVAKLRSKPIRAHQPVVKYVEDDIMAALLESLTDAGFDTVSRPRPHDPKGMGAKAEVTIVRTGSTPRSLIRMRGQSAETAEIYLKCLKSIMAVQAFVYSPQASSGGGADIGVHRVNR
ncbi:MAG: hypothetical protein V3T86_03300 [Planctomycetota bacterium]